MKFTIEANERDYQERLDYLQNYLFYYIGDWAKLIIDNGNGYLIDGLPDYDWAVQERQANRAIEALKKGHKLPAEFFFVGRSELEKIV